MTRRTHSRMAALYTAAVAPTRPPEAARVWGGRREARSNPRRRGGDRRPANPPARAARIAGRRRAARRAVSRGARRGARALRKRWMRPTGN